MKTFMGVFAISFIVLFSGCSSDFLKQTDYFNIQSLKSPTGVKIGLSGAQIVTAGQCAAYSVNLELGEAANVSLLASEGEFFQDAQCAQTVAQVALTKASANRTVYYRNELAQPAILSAEDSGSAASATFNVQVNPDVTSQATLTAPTSSPSGQNFAASVQFFDQFGNPSPFNQQVQLEYRAAGTTNNYQGLQTVTSSSTQVSFPAVSITISSTTTATFDLRARQLNSAGPVISNVRQVAISPGAPTQVIIDPILNQNLNPTTSLAVSQVYSVKVRVRDGQGQPSSALIDLLTPGYGGFTGAQQTCVDECTFSNLQFTQPAAAANPVTLRARISGTVIQDEITGITVTNDVPASVALANFGNPVVATSETRSVQVTVKNAQQQQVSAVIELLVPNYNGFTLRSQTCNGSCSFNNLQFTQATPSTTINLVARVQNMPSVSGQITGISVISPYIRLSKQAVLGEPVFVDLLQHPRIASNDPNVRVLWDWGDGSNGEGRVQAHYYNAANTYTITATIQTPSGLLPAETLVHTVSAYSTLPNRVDMYVANGGTAAANASTAANPTNWGAAIARVASIQGQGGTRTIRIFVRRGDTIQIQESQQLVLNGTGRVTVEAYGSAASRPVLNYNVSTGTGGVLINGIQNGLVLRNLILTGNGTFNRNDPGIYSGGNRVYVQVEGNDHFFQNVEFRKSVYAILGHMVGQASNTRQNWYYDYSRKLVLGCDFVDMFVAALGDFGATYFGIQASTFDYSGILGHATIGEIKRGIIENNSFSVNSTISQGSGLEEGALSINSYKSNPSGINNRDIVIQDNDFYNTSHGIELSGNRTDQKIDRIWIKRNTVRGDDILSYFNQDTNAGIRASGVRDVLIQNNVFSILASDKFASIYFSGIDASSNILIRHNSTYSNAENAAFVSAFVPTNNIDIVANNVVFDNPGLLSTPFELFPSTGMGQMTKPGMFNFAVMDDNQVTNNVDDGSSVILIPAITSWYHTSQTSRDHATWVNPFGKGVNDALGDPQYANVSQHNLRIPLGSLSVDRSGADTVFIEQDKDDRDTNNDSGAYEAEDLGPGGGEPIVSSSSAAFMPFRE